MLLVGDIGGTNTRLALYEYSDTLKQVCEDRFLSSNYNSLYSAINFFLKKNGKDIKIKAASFGIAGPVKDGICKATNIPWVIDIQALKKELKIENIFLLNDLQANAYGINALDEDEFFVINEGKKNHGNACILAAGTGLGEAGMYFDGVMKIPFATEGGHTDFAPRNEIEIELFRYLKNIYGHVSYERILSGMGINNLYRFLVDIKKVQINKIFDEEIKKHSQPQVVITQKALNNECTVCVDVFNWFVSLYGAESSNLALKHFAIGGVYIGGGIAPKILNFFKNKNFMNAFIDKGRFSNLVNDIPVKLILNERATLLGAAYFAFINR